MKAIKLTVLSLLLSGAYVSQAQSQFSKDELNNELTAGASLDCLRSEGACHSASTAGSLTEDRARSKRIVDEVLAGLTPESPGSSTGTK